MAGLIEKNYGDALFELLTEEKPDMLKTVQGELAAVNDILTANPELIKLCRTPSIEKSEKYEARFDYEALIQEAIDSEEVVIVSAQSQKQDEDFL